MIIRKKFKYEAAHIVRNCSSERCKFSIHGHSYVIEVFFSSNILDNGGMIMDFGLTKGIIKDLIDGFDHCYQYWNKESKEFINFIHENSARWIEMPVSPSAENYSIMFLYIIDKFINAIEFANGEGKVIVESVRVHETDTGYAESFQEDLKYSNFANNLSLESIKFSKQVKAEWSDPLMYDKLIAFEKINDNKVNEKPFKMNAVEQQVPINIQIK